MKAAIIILSDPKSGSEEALGRVFNALAAAYDFKQKGDEITVLFQGAGTRWLAELSKPNHTAHALFEEVRDTVAGASKACAEVFGASDEVAASGFDLISENPVPGTAGLPSVQALLTQGHTVLTF